MSVGAPIKLIWVFMGQDYRRLNWNRHNGEMTEIHSPLQARLVQWMVQTGDVVAPGDVLVILEAMKMEHEIRAPRAGTVQQLFFYGRRSRRRT